MGWQWSQGRFVGCDSVPLTDRGFRYGMSVFESLRIDQGRALFLAEHLDRLRAACRERDFRIDENAIERCGDVLSEDGFGRIYVTAGDGGATSATDDSRMFVFIEPRQPIPSLSYDLGLELAPHRPLFNGAKTANYWANLDALQRGSARQKNETLLFDPHGRLISACVANVFLVRDGIIQTPSLGHGARDGVVRSWVLQRREVQQCELSRADVEGADEIFLTSSWLGIMRVARLEERPLAVPAVATELFAEYQREVLGR